MQLYVRVIESKNGRGGYHRDVQLAARPFDDHKANVYREESYNIHNANWMISTLDSLKNKYDLDESDSSFSFNLPFNSSVRMGHKVTISSGIEVFDLFTAEQNEHSVAQTTALPGRIRFGKKA